MCQLNDSSSNLFCMSKSYYVLFFYMHTKQGEKMTIASHFLHCSKHNSEFFKSENFDF